MLTISRKAQILPASPIRKLVPYADAAKKRGIKVYHLNIGQPDIESPKEALDAVKNFDGKCYLAVEDEKAIGLIMGIIPGYDEFDYLDYKCPKRGEITELVVSSKVRSKGIGNLLMSEMENYFKECGCEYVLVDVFGYNDNAIKFYDKHGYHTRMYVDIKKLD